MENTIVQLSKYVITFLMICFTVQSFAALKERDEDERHYILMRQIIMIILMNFICFFVMFLQEGEVSTIQMFLLTMAYILGVQILYRLIYRKASMILVNNMCMLLRSYVLSSFWLFPFPDSSFLPACRQIFC